MAKKEDDFGMDVSIFEKSGKTAFSQKLIDHKEKVNNAFSDLLVNIKQEAIETQDASKILVKYIKAENISKEEEKEFRTQVYDLLKVLGIGVPFALIPGASLLMPFLIKMAKKKGMEILPTAFNKSKEKD